MDELSLRNVFLQSTKSRVNYCILNMYFMIMYYVRCVFGTYRLYLRWNSPSTITWDSWFLNIENDSIRVERKA